jgi:hypothetical protein
MRTPQGRETLDQSNLFAQPSEHKEMHEAWWQSHKKKSVKTVNSWPRDMAICYWGKN